MREVELCDSLAVFMLPGDLRKERLETGDFNPTAPCVQVEKKKRKRKRKKKGV